MVKHRRWAGGISLALMLLCSACKPAQPVADFYPSAKSVRLFVAEEYDAKKTGTGYLNPRGTLLSVHQEKLLEAALLKEPTPEEMTACFVPHHFFRFYDAGNKEIGEVAVCFCCAGVQATGESNIQLASGQILNMNFGKMQQLVESMGAPTDINCD